MRLLVYIRRERSEERLVNNEKAVDPNFYKQRRKNLERVSDAPPLSGAALLCFPFGRDDVQPLKVLCAAGHQEPRLQLWTKLPPLFFVAALERGRLGSGPLRHFGDKKAISSTWPWCWGGGVGGRE